MKNTAISLFTLSALAFSGLAATPASAAAAKCGERTKLVEILKKNYKEIPVALGISQKNTEAFEIFASDEGSWTVMMTRSNGQTCIMAAGHSWRDLPKHISDVKT